MNFPVGSLCLKNQDDGSNALGRNRIPEEHSLRLDLPFPRSVPPARGIVLRASVWGEGELRTTLQCYLAECIC